MYTHTHTCTCFSVNFLSHSAKQFRDLHPTASKRKSLKQQWLSLAIHFLCALMFCVASWAIREEWLAPNGDAHLLKMTLNTALNDEK